MSAPTENNWKKDYEIPIILHEPVVFDMASSAADSVMNRIILNVFADEPGSEYLLKTVKEAMPNSTVCLASAEIDDDQRSEVIPILSSLLAWIMSKTIQAITNVPPRTKAALIEHLDHEMLKKKVADYKLIEVRGYEDWAAKKCDAVKVYLQDTNKGDTWVLYMKTEKEHLAISVEQAPTPSK